MENKINWTILIKDNYDTYPKEGYSVLVSDGLHSDVAWFIASSEYRWLKTNIIEDYSYDFKEFEITKWAYIND
jgi:hypothetical protein